jgi:Plasmid pRiA4b ORF-3-like protein
MRNVFQLKITLLDVDPPIWRRILVPDEITLEKLHDIFQFSIGWEHYHLHEFRIGDADLDETKVRLRDVLGEIGAQAIYAYDFGDGWEHSVVVEQIFPPEPDVVYPRCIAGERRGPPEDSGGPFGYQDFLDAITNPKHREHKAMREWIGGPYDAEQFSIEDVNRLLPLVIRRRAKQSK